MKKEMKKFFDELYEETTEKGTNFEKEIYFGDKKIKNGSQFRKAIFDVIVGECNDRKWYFSSDDLKGIFEYLSQSDDLLEDRQSRTDLKNQYLEEVHTVDMKTIREREDLVSFEAWKKARSKNKK